MREDQRSPGGARMQQGGDWGEFLDPAATGPRAPAGSADEAEASEFEKKDAEVDEASRESFPASDPPSFTPERIGPPKKP